MRKRFLAAVLLLMAFIPTVVRAQLRQFIDGQTLLAGQADLTKADPVAIEQWLRQLMEAAGMTGAGAPPPQVVDETFGKLKSGLASFTAAGGKDLYVVTAAELIHDGGFAVIAPAASNGDARKLAALMFSGRVDGPTSAPAVDRRQSGRIYPMRAEVIGGNVAVWGIGNAINYVKNVKPFDRPDITAGLAALGDSPVKVVIAPTPPIRMMLSGFWPPKIFDQSSTVVTNDLQWIAAGATLPRTAGVKIIAKSSSAESAQALNHIVTYGLAAMSGVPPTISPDLAKLLTPAVNGDQLVVSLDNAKLTAVAKELAVPLAEARKNAARSMTMSNMRQISMACTMYANDNKGKWPDDLKATAKYLGGGAKQVLTNPMHPELTPGFIYIKPANPRVGGGEKMVLYAAHKAFGSGVCVGFLDGHVEFVNNKERFDDLVAKTTADEPAQ